MDHKKKQLPAGFFEHFKWHFYAIATIPGLLAIWISTSEQGADSLIWVPSFLKMTGACVLLIAFLQQIILPIRIWTGQAGFYIFRRPAGYFITAYAFIHFAVWFWAVAESSVTLAQLQIYQMPVILLGLVALLIMLFMLYFEKAKSLQMLANKWLYWQVLWWIAIVMWIFYIKNSYPNSLSDFILYTILSLLLCWHIYEAIQNKRRIKAAMDKINPHKK